MIRRTRRRGFTLLELLAVLAALLVLGALILPTLSGLRGNTNLKAGADILRSLLAEGRAKAIEDGRNYKLSFTADGRTIRVEPDAYITDPMAQTEQPVTRQEDLPAGVTIALVESDSPVTDASGIQRVATLLPDGTCREDSVFVQLNEDGVAPLTLRIRGLTGNVTVTANPTGGQP
jgi:prepilin-type N-terminal cleavage/methylation domain-containing protein